MQNVYIFKKKHKIKMCQRTPLYPCGVFYFEKELYKMRLQQNKQQVL